MYSCDTQTDREIDRPANDVLSDLTEPKLEIWGKPYVSPPAVINPIGWKIHRDEIQTVAKSRGQTQMH